MTLQEQALVFASLIVGLAVADQLNSMHRLLKRRSAVRWDWLSLWVAALILLTQVQVWWGLAGEPAGSVSIGEFLPTLMTLIILFLLAAASLPDEVPVEGVDLKSFYQQQHPYIWSLYSLALGWLTLVNLLQEYRAGKAWADILSYKGGDLLVLGVMVSLIFVRRRWWHLLAMMLLTIGPIGWLSRTLG